MRLSARWAKRCRIAFDETRDQALNPGAKLFGIVQGGMYEDLRLESLAALD